MSRRGRPSDIGSAECNMSDYPVHIDPLDPDTPTPDKSMWTPLRRDAWASQEMEAFRESLRIRGLPDIRSAALDDLSSDLNLDAKKPGSIAPGNPFEPSSVSGADFATQRSFAC